MIRADTKYYPKYVGLSSIPKKEFVFFKQRIFNAIKKGEINTQPVLNKHTGFIIEFESVKHGINSRATVLKIKSFTVIREVLKYALLHDMAADKRSGAETIYYFFYVMMIDGTPHEVRFTIKDNGSKKHYYHHDLTSVKPNKKLNPF